MKVVQCYETNYTIYFDKDMKKGLDELNDKLHECDLNDTQLIDENIDDKGVTSDTELQLARNVILEFWKSLMAGKKGPKPDLVEAVSKLTAKDVNDLMDRLGAYSRHIDEIGERQLSHARFTLYGYNPCSIYMEGFRCSSIGYKRTWCKKVDSPPKFDVFAPTKKGLETAERELKGWKNIGHTTLDRKEYPNGNVVTHVRQHYRVELFLKGKEITHLRNALDGIARGNLTFVEETFKKDIKFGPAKNNDSNSIDSHELAAVKQYLQNVIKFFALDEYKEKGMEYLPDPIVEAMDLKQINEILKHLRLVDNKNKKVPTELEIDLLGNNSGVTLYDEGNKSIIFAD